MSYGIKNIIKSGQKFNRLTVIKEVPGETNRKVLCQCDCGNKSTSSYTNIKNGHTKSCGCLGRENAANRQYKHGLARTKFYDVYSKIKSRCENKNDKDYKNYGGRGIRCFWKSFKEFKDDMYNDYLKHKKNNTGTNTRIDRIDNDGNYCKENCKWSTHKEQARNRRGNHLLTYKGKIQTLTEWAEEVKLPRHTLNNRIVKYGWSIKRALTLPNKFYAKNKTP
jgi:hypothetical protein